MNHVLSAWQKEKECTEVRNMEIIIGSLSNDDKRQPEVDFLQSTVVILNKFMAKRPFKSKDT